jgi:hypothetical protein
VGVGGVAVTAETFGKRFFLLVLFFFIFELELQPMSIEEEGKKRALLV